MRRIIGFRDGCWNQVSTDTVLDAEDEGHCLLLDVPESLPEDEIADHVIECFDRYDDDRIAERYALAEAA